VDNGHYGETGNQDSHTGLGVRLDRIAQGAGFPVVHTINSEDDLAEGKRLLREGGKLAFLLLRVKEGPPLSIKRNRDAAYAFQGGVTDIAEVKLSARSGSASPAPARRWRWKN
jgi:hypothetical protein